MGDLEEEAEKSRNAIADLDSVQREYNKVKADETKHGIQEKENFNKKLEAKKDTLVKDIADAAAKIKNLMEVLAALKYGHEDDGRVTPEEIRVEGGKIPQGLKTVV